MIRKFLEREGQFLLQEFGAPDAPTLWRRVAFLACVTAGRGIVLGAKVALYVLFGLAVMWLGVVVIYLLYLSPARRAPVYFDDGVLLVPGGGRRSSNCRQSSTSRLTSKLRGHSGSTYLQRCSRSPTR
jgi:hypothetical protein